MRLGVHVCVCVCVCVCECVCVCVRKQGKKRVTAPGTGKYRLPGAVTLFFPFFFSGENMTRKGSQSPIRS